jgi:hypothetical protein
MKKIILESFAIISVGLFTSCSSNFLDEKIYGKVSTDTYPASVSNLESLTTALYGKCNEMYFKTGVRVVSFCGDDVTTLSGGNKASFLELDNFSAQDNNANLGSTWQYAYDVIKQANDMIGGTDKVTEDASYSTTALENIKNRVKGQAYFMRALAYFNLVRTFGRVPLVTTLDINYNETNAEFSDIYARIVADLQQADSLLPKVYSKAENLTSLESSTAYARVTSGAAKSLLASVYLDMAGYPLKETAYYAKAAEMAKEVIDAESDYGYELLPENQLWSYKNGWKSTGNAEGVFTCFFNTNSSWVGEGSNGNYIAMGLTPTEMNGWNDAFAEINFFNEFPAGIRKKYTFITDIYTKDSTVVTHWDKFSSKHPHYRKYVEMEGTDWANMDNYIDWWSNRTIPVIRYAEVLLIYAEAQAMADGTPNELAYKCLNRVRERAGLEDMQTGLSGEAFAKKVIEERKWEFAGMEPCSRWFDLVRTETAGAAMEDRSSSDPELVNKPNDTTHEHYFAPIPEHDTQLDALLTSDE